MPVYQPKPDLRYNQASDSDSYKFSHEYTPGCTRMQSYLEARGGEFKECTLFGLQYLVHKYLSKRVTSEDVQEMSEFMPLHGEPFDAQMWQYIVDKLDGRIPLRIRAIPEGLVVPIKNAVMTVESTDPRCHGLVSFFETKQERLWYPSSIAVSSRESFKILKYFLDKTSDTAEQDVIWKMQDFGARGVTCFEQSQVGGAAHLASGFFGSDTVEGVRMANHYYDCKMAGFSIPATEHSMMTMDGPEGEVATAARFVQKQLVERQLPPGIPKLAACVSDTYDIYRMTKAWCGPVLLPLVQKSGGTLVIRPDSGNPLEVLPRMFAILEENLPKGSVTLRKGYKMLPSYYRIIQGDGVNRQSMTAILELLTGLGWSAANIGFGSGGALLQMINRDTQKWAYKNCAALVNGRWVDTRKNPITDPGKQSKGGWLDLVQMDGEYKTIALPNPDVLHPDSVMNTVFENGDILFHTTFDEVRARMAV